MSFGPLRLADLATARDFTLAVESGRDVEPVAGGRLVRTRAALNGELSVLAEPDDGLIRVSVTVRNTGLEPPTRTTRSPVR